MADSERSQLQKAGHAAEQNELGLQRYGAWKIDEAIGAFQKAIAADPDNPEYHLNLAGAYARSGDYGEALRSLGNYLHTETDTTKAAQIERLFSSALDDVETQLVENMRSLELAVPIIGKALQMWLEYRIILGRRPLNVANPETWAAALTYAVVKINLHDATLREIAAQYGTGEQALKERYEELVTTLDLMPADFRYFAGEENPLDKLVEAAQLLEKMYGRFYEE